MRLTVLTLLVFGILLFGCFGPAEETNTDNETDTTPPVVVKTPSFTISSPAASEIFYTQGETADITLLLSTQNLVLKQPGGAAKTGEGHFKVSVDGSPATIVTTKNYVVSGLGIGEHTIKVELWKNDQTSYGISRQVSFTIEKEAPAEYIPTTYTVEINGFEYSPSDLTISRTDSVTFVNKGIYPQSATCFIEGEEVFDTGVLAPNANATIVFDEAFTCEYYSTMYSFVKGTITVEPNPTDES